MLSYFLILRFFYVFLYLLLILLQLTLKELKHLANGLITFDIKGNPVFSNGPSNLPRNPPVCIILDTLYHLRSVDK